jgi:hypothetical protein
MSRQNQINKGFLLSYRNSLELKSLQIMAKADETYKNSMELNFLELRCLASSKQL